MRKFRKTGGPPMSRAGRRQRLIGYAVLAFGAALLLAVSYMALQAYQAKQAVRGAGLAADAGQKKAKAAPAPVDFADMGATQPRAANVPGQGDIRRKQGPAFDMAKIQGTWAAALPGGRAFLEYGRETFQIMYVPTSTSDFTRFSRGTIFGEGAYLVMTPRGDMGRPVNKDNPLERYKILTMREYPVEIGFADGNLVWTPGPAQSTGSPRTAVHPLFREAGGDRIVWQRF